MPTCWGLQIRFRKRFPAFCWLRCRRVCAYVGTCATLTYCCANMLTWRMEKGSHFGKHLCLIFYSQQNHAHAHVFFLGFTCLIVCGTRLCACKANQVGLWLRSRSFSQISPRFHVREDLRWVVGSRNGTALQTFPRQMAAALGLCVPSEVCKSGSAARQAGSSGADAYLKPCP